MNSLDLPKQVRDFLIQKTGAKVYTEADDCLLVGAGLIDSFGLVTLLAEVEGKFGVFPDLMSHDPRDYSTLQGLSRIILQSLGATFTAESEPNKAVARTADQPSVLLPPNRIERLNPSHPLWSSLPGLFKEMFGHFANVGVQLPLMHDGEHLWLKSIEGLPARVFFIAGAIKDNELHGFITGQMKLLPSYLGGRWVGDVAHVFVRPSSRRQGFASGLFSAAIQWFHMCGASSIELQVLSQNAGAQAFWQHQGFQPELVQFRKHLAD
jgi:GNAT superfamily N-acetyltransferase